MSQKTYREYIYGNYRATLENNRIYKDVDKERAMIKKYICKNYINHFPKDKSIKILDLGCGMGHYLYALRELGYENCMGVDLSEENVEFCQKSGIKCEKAEALEFLNKNHNSFDIIIFNDVIEHLTKDEMFEILVAMKKSLNDKGKLIIKTYNMANPFTGLSGRYMDFTHELGFTEVTFYQIFKALNFKSIKVLGADIYCVYGLAGYLPKLISKLIYFIYYLLNCLCGRKIIKIFEKNLICVVEK